MGDVVELNALEGVWYQGSLPEPMHWDTAEVWRIEDGKKVPLRHFPHHSPTGMSWHYGGSGPSDLALAILCDALGEEPTKEDLYRGQFRNGREVEAQRLHQQFKWAFVARWPLAGWLISRDEVMAWVDQQRHG